MIATKALRHKEVQRRMSKCLLIPVMIMLTLSTCNPKQAKKLLPENKIKGNWAFLDGRGNYNEAFFADSSFITYNMAMGAAPEFRYFIKNDSLFTNTDKRKTGLNRIAKVEWMTLDKVIFTTEFSRDTLERISGETITLGNTDPLTDSLLFRANISIRYEKFLIAKGILNPEEVESFKKDGTIPPDIIEQKK